MHKFKRNCNSLKSIIIPESVNSIFYESSPAVITASFEYCEGLENIVVDSSNKTFKSVNNCLINISDKTLVLGCKNSVIPTDGSVTSILGKAFSGCTGLATIVIPEAVDLIQHSAFKGCTGLTSVIFEITTGWVYKINGNPIIIESSQLADSADAASYLISKNTYPWIRSEAE